MSTLPGSLNFEVYMPKNRHFGPFFWGRRKLKNSDFHQILHGRSATCSLGVHQISGFSVHAFWRYYPKLFLKMVILKYVFMFKVKYEPLRDLRLPPNFTGREGIMSPRCPPKFSNLAPLFLKLLTNKLQKMELLELFGRFEVKYGLLRHLVFKWNLTWCQLKVLTMSCTNFSGLCQLLGEI